MVTNKFQWLLGKNTWAMTLWPFIIVKKRVELTPSLLNHEKIHLKQQIECLIIFFYLWYLIEYLIRIILYRDIDKAYRNISFEKEAYFYENNLDYLNHRKIFSFLKFIK